MKRLLAALILIFLLPARMFALEVDCSGKVGFEIETYVREGNEESPCPVDDDYPNKGTAILSLNNAPVQMFSSGSTRDYCVGASTASPSPSIMRGCIDYSHVNKTGANTVTIGITNTNPEAYTNVNQRAFLITSSSRIFLTSWSRQGKYPDHVFTGASTVSLSALVFSDSGPEAAKKIKNIDYMLAKLNELRILNDSELEKWKDRLAAFLDMDARLIDLNLRGPDIPEWFKDLIRSVQKGQEQLIKNPELAKRIKEKAQVALINDVLAFLDVVKDVAECAARHKQPAFTLRFMKSTRVVGSAMSSRWTGLIEASALKISARTFRPSSESKRRAL